MPNPIVYILNHYQNDWQNYILTEDKSGKRYKMKHANNNYLDLERNVIRYFNKITEIFDCKFKVLLGSKNPQITSSDNISICLLIDNMKLSKGVYPYVGFNLKEQKVYIFIGRNDSKPEDTFPDNIFRRFSNEVETSMRQYHFQRDEYNNVFKTFSLRSLETNINNFETILIKLITIYIRVYNSNIVRIREYIRNNNLEKIKIRSKSELANIRKLKRKYSQSEEQYQIETNKPPKQTTNTVKSWKRDPSIGRKALARVHYSCEHVKSHKTFISKTSENYFVECHHLVPMEYQGDFGNNPLDILDNIVSLCPLCHRILHHGKTKEVEKILKKLFKERKAKLLKNNIDTSYNDLLKKYKLD